MRRKPEIIKTNDIKIKTTGMRTAELLLNDKKLEGIMGYKLEHRGGEVPKLTIELSLVAGDVFLHEIGEFEIHLEANQLSDEIKWNIYEQLKKELGEE